MENLKQNLMKAIKSNYTTKDSDSIKDFNKFSQELGEKKEENTEATGAGAAGGFVPPLSGSQTEEDKIEKVEATEGTGSGSSGSY